MLIDHRDLLLAFNEHSVRYLLVGGYALGVYTEPRATRDLDLFVDASLENAQRVFVALAQFGAPLDDYSPADFTDIYSGFQVGAPPNQAELIFALSGGISFQEAWIQSEPGITAEDIPVRVLSPQHFIRNKLAAGRLQDLADADAVRRARNINGGD
jgi:hypothetical protein